MVQFQSRLYDYMMYELLLWETTDRDVNIITLSKLGRKTEMCNITIPEQSKFETYITRSVVRRWRHCLWFLIATNCTSNTLIWLWSNMDPSLYRGDHTVLYCLSQSCGWKLGRLVYVTEATTQYGMSELERWVKRSLCMLQRRPRSALSLCRSDEWKVRHVHVTEATTLCVKSVPKRWVKSSPCSCYRGDHVMR